MLLEAGGGRRVRGGLGAAAARASRSVPAALVLAALAGCSEIVLEPVPIALSRVAVSYAVR